MNLSGYVLQGKSENAGQPGIVFLTFQSPVSPLGTVGSINVAVDSATAATMSTGGKYDIAFTPVVDAQAQPAAVPEPSPAVEAAAQPTGA